MALQEGARKANGPARAGDGSEVTTPEDYLGDVIGDLSRRGTSRARSSAEPA